MKEKRNLSSLLDNKVFVMVLSLVAAFVLWVVVVFTFNDEITRTISNVPVNLSLNNASFQSLGLEIVNRGEIKVSVTVRGSAAAVGSLTAEHITVTPSYTRVSQTGTYDLTLTAVKANPLDNLTYTIVSVDPKTISLSFDTAVLKTLEVEPVSDNTLQAKEGFIIENVTTSPQTIKVTGPQNEVELIDSAVVRFSMGGTLTKTETLSDLPVVLLDKSGNELPLANLNIDAPLVDVRIPVYKLGTLPLKIEYTNVPEGFDTDTLRPLLSVSEIEVAGKESVIDTLTPRTVGFIDLTTFSIGAVYTFDVTLPSGMVNRGAESVTVTFPTEDIGSKRINVTDIRLENVPTQYEVELLTTRINNVSIIGRAEDVETLLPGSVVAIVDMSEMSAVKIGQSTATVKFVVTSNSTTWVAGSYSVNINVRESS